MYDPRRHYHMHIMKKLFKGETRIRMILGGSPLQAPNSSGPHLHFGSLDGALKGTSSQIIVGPTF